MSGNSARIVLRGPRVAARDAIEPLREFSAQAGLPTELQNDLLVIADEVVSNWLKYGRTGSQTPEMEIQVSVEEGRLLLRFSDTGPAFNPLAVALPDLEVPLEQRPIGGLGVHLVRALTERQGYARVGNRNVLELSRSLPK